MPLVGECRRHPDVDDRDIGPFGRDGHGKGVRIADGGRDLEAGLLEDARQGGPDEAAVLG